MEDNIVELFKRVSEEEDLMQKFRYVEILITRIKLEHGLEIPFSKCYGGDISAALKYYIDGKYEECIYELRKVKLDIMKEITRSQNQTRKIRSNT
ncbi:MAG: hypothetical protein ACP5NC_04190 [Nitrososphaeria archaeon]